MKKFILFFSLLVFAGTTPAMEIGIIKQFNNRRPALSRFKMDDVDLRDFNRDGTRDIATTFNDTMFVFDPLTKDRLWQFDMTTLGASWVDMQLLGFMMIHGEVVSHAVFSSGRASQNNIVSIVEVNSKVVLYEIDKASAHLALKLPSTGKEALAVTSIDEATGQNVVLIIGDTGGNNTVISNASYGTGLLTSFASDYQLDLKFQAEPGLRLAYDPDLFDPRHDLDIDGDERMDIPMIIEDPNANNEPAGLIVRGGDNYDVLWQFPFPAEHKENILKGFFGFVDANGDGEKETILGENLAVTLDGTVHTIADNFVTLDVNDVDGDGVEDIIGLNTTDSTVVVYGTMTATSVGDYNPAAIHFQLFQNYPNPFNPSTTISYSVAAAGDVQLKIYNPLGQLVRTLFSGQKGAGEYTLTWDGRDDAGRLLSSGPYFYRLQVGEAVQSRRMLFLK